MQALEYDRDKNMLQLGSLNILSDDNETRFKYGENFRENEGCKQAPKPSCCCIFYSQIVLKLKKVQFLFEKIAYTKNHKGN